MSARRYESYRRLRRLREQLLARAAPCTPRRSATRATVDWRPAMACASVPPSMYSSSPPTGTPCAMRLARMPRWRTSCARKCAVASPSTVEFVASMTSRTWPPSSSAIELRAAELLGTDAVERRQVAHQHEVAPAVAARLLDRHHVGRRFDHAQQRGIALAAGADFAQFRLGQHAALAAAADALDRTLQAPWPASAPPGAHPAADERPCAARSSGPTPGSARSASIRAESAGECCIRTAVSCRAAAAGRP